MEAYQKNIKQMARMAKLVGNDEISIMLCITQSNRAKLIFDDTIPTDQLQALLTAAATNFKTYIETIPHKKTDNDLTF